ncbi:MAG: FAD-dependent oxidoreductase [Lentisphaerae bacterium]|nr:FAD-dependent oxidoreductase [Lentisphaerota bacterium]
MNTQTETLHETLTTPVAGRYDIIVAGSGPAGFAAAITAGRMGARTLLLEQTHAVGGIATSGLMSHWTGATQGPLYNEILERESQPGPEEKYSGRHIINPDKLKLVMLEMLQEAGVDLLLYTFVAAPVMEGNRVVGVITENKNGRQAWRAASVIDATGDGDLAARAGAPYRKGREPDGGMQPVTIMFKVAGVDYSRAVFPGSFETNFEIPGGRIQDLGHAHLPHPAGHVLLYPSSLPGVVTVNMTNQTGIDGTLAEDLTRAELACRRQIEQIVPFLRDKIPGYEKCFLISTASLMGVRETRHFIGDYTLTAEDIVEARVFDDWIATRCSFNFDIHNVTGAGLDKDGVQHKFRSKGNYTIPYRCLLPQGIEGLLLAGRSISGTHKAHSSFRVMPICVNIGQGAATAAVTALRDGVGLREVDIAKVQHALGEQGVTVG